MKGKRKTNKRLDFIVRMSMFLVGTFIFTTSMMSLIATSQVNINPATFIVDENSLFGASTDVLAAIGANASNYFMLGVLACIGLLAMMFSVTFSDERRSRKRNNGTAEFKERRNRH